MDVFNDQPYFSEHVILLAHTSALVRYAACATAAKHLGQMRDPESQVRPSRSQKRMLKHLIDSNLGFTWYGAKYYEKAIQLLTKQISHEDRSVSASSPNCIYQPGMSASLGENNLLDEYNHATTSFQILAACILCQYEDLSATQKAWSGHLSGLWKLFQPWLGHNASPLVFHAPHPVRAMEASFWYFVFNDMLDACESRRSLFGAY